METGYRPGSDGKRLPRDIIQRFSCRYDGDTVFAADLYPAISANPFLAFHTVATRKAARTGIQVGRGQRLRHTPSAWRSAWHEALA
jgi:hypothetical protein